ncbi:MAG: hypothetical protein JW724_06635 [Candidatus Altiarchaeota archaeon]|nr:hypothetical protein [Candidatus Altiarchaeota archaeon]
MPVKKIILALAFMYLVSGTALAEDAYMKVKEPKERYSVGEDVTIEFEVTNPTDRVKSFTCVLTFDPPTSKNPACSTKDIVLQPGETYTGSLSEFADMEADSRATIKLTEGSDIVVEEYSMDVKVTYMSASGCGNGACEEGESYLICPEDCTSGSADDYCDAMEDGVCDPDCERTVDPDCTCNADGSCEEGIEDYENCPQDCPTGSRDGLCDGMVDGVCDPDCVSGEDTDCAVGEQGLMEYIPYIAGIIALLAVVMVAACFIHGRMENKKIEKERKDFLRWKKEKENL